uniref:Prostamide/prostaglandin F synthase n=1 Tax=Xenopsylla cheopis TaxID=163159 RepID=A0A6M2DNJ6_XENCH
MDISKIAKTTLKNIKTGDTITMESLWADKTAVVIFFRRWGCMFCRVWAKEISEISDEIEANGARLVGIGVDSVGAKEFVEGNFFKGDLYISEEQKIYNDLGFKRFNIVSILTSLLWKESREAVSKGRALGVGGDMKGDGLQNGGALVVQKGGKVLFEFKQDGPAEQVPNSKFLEILKAQNAKN